MQAGQRRISSLRHRDNVAVSLKQLPLVRHGRLRPGASPAAAAAQQPAAEAPPRIQLPGIDGYIALTPEPEGPGFIPAHLQPAAPWVRPPERTFTGPSIRDTGTLRPGPEWFPAWMKYRRREDNYVFWQDKFLRCSLEIPGAQAGNTGGGGGDMRAHCLPSAGGKPPHGP